MSPTRVPCSGPEIGEMWLHLPSGGAGIHGFVPDSDGGPVTGGVVREHVPVSQGGSIRLFHGLDPHEFDPQPGPIIDLRLSPRRFDRYGFNWAQRATTDVQAEAERRGWRTITRAHAVRVLTELGYHVHPRRDANGRPFFHDVIYRDQADDLTWHVRESLDGTRFTWERCVFVLRDRSSTSRRSVSR
ncbi:hypothetical protein [Amycolatopsis anabasis]|uniref:hypothetical protein n=1 Tax=Amycolatopsis anabasis TaxID=1840409 RepID=UPI00131B2D5B|nr:hypothetical protein [Amycolatopsis anabasis]